MYSKTLLLTAACVLSSFGARAQWNIVHETDQVMSFGIRPCFQVEFKNTKDDLIADVWKDFAKQKFDAKVKKDKKTGEWVATEASAGYISGGVFTIYVTIEQRDKDAVFNAWFDTGQPNFLNSRDNRDEAREAGNAIRMFYYDVRRAVINEELKAAEKDLGEQEGKLKKLQRDKDNLQKAIEDYKAKIKKAEEDIVANTKSQETATIDINGRKKRIEEIQLRLKNVETEKQ